MGKWNLINEQINSLVWGKYMICALLLCGIWLMIRTKFLPFTKLSLIFKKTLGSLGKKDKGEGVTSFQAVSTALAGTLGVGSIVGVASALTMGGPGALFWMCLSAIVGMMTKYGEVVLAIVYRQRKRDGSLLGGPMTVLEKGCHLPLLGVLFALLCILASFGIGNLTPANTIYETIQAYVPISSLCLGFFLMFIVAVVILGKGNSIMRFNERIIPLISILYLGACMYLILLHMDTLPQVVHEILQDAFTLPAGVGGVGGFAISKAIHFGISRGVFSNEAGMGSSPISHASVQDVDPVEQGFWGIFEVFFDTIVVCMITGIMILSSGLYQEGMNAVTLMIQCFESGFGSMAGIVFAIAIVSFAIPSILGWYYYASQCIRYISEGKLLLWIYQILFLGLLLVGSQLKFDFVWNVADTLNGLMSIPNLISIFILSPVVVKLTKEYLKKHRSD